MTTNGFLFAGIGGGCIVSLVILQLGAMFLHDRTLLLITEVLMAGGFALLINYPFDSYVRLLPPPSSSSSSSPPSSSTFCG